MAGVSGGAGEGRAVPPRASGGVDAVRVVIVDDEQLVRAGLALLLGGDPGVEVVGEAGDGLEAESVIDATQPDVVLMDIRMPRRDGLEATERELARRPGLAVLVLTTFDADDMVLRALRVGARGFLLKDTPPAELVAAVHAAARGRATLSPTVLDTVIAAAGRGSAPAPGSAAGPGSGSASTAARQRLAVLTEREAEVVTGVARGLSNGQIAAELFVSLATVKTHLGHAYDKLGVGGRVQLALLAREAGAGVPAAGTDGQRPG
ncbi:LuxR family two component transcriptional regulator [Frigoribacterium sp. PhB160]|nr:LuxR family two component transcriptional regulator [Frigoribacterium sp. PhB160]